jgi:hypothetical protein
MTFCLGTLLAQAGEEAAARKPVEDYLQGHATGKAEHMDRAFHPGAHIQGHRLGGTFVDWTLEEYKKGFRGTPAEDEAQRKRTIDFVQVNGTAGIAKATLDYPAAIFTDYFVLLKHEGQWKIMNKVFAVQKK